MKVELPQIFFTQIIFYFWFCSENEEADVAEFWWEQKPNMKRNMVQMWEQSFNQ